MNLLDPFIHSSGVLVVAPFLRNNIGYNHIRRAKTAPRKSSLAPEHSFAAAHGFENCRGNDQF